jgi:hypothetical protein
MGDRDRNIPIPRGFGGYMFNREIARQNDARLLKLANYIESKGTTRHIRSMEQVFKRFGYLKCILKNGTFPNIEELEESIYKIYGITDNDLDSNEESAMIAQMIKMSEDDLKALEDEEAKKHKDKGSPEVH